MGFGIYLKSGKNKEGRSPLFIKITSHEKIFKKNIGILIKKEDWNSRTYQVKKRKCWCCTNQSKTKCISFEGKGGMGAI